MTWLISFQTLGKDLSRLRKHLLGEYKQREFRYSDWFSLVQGSLSSIEVLSVLQGKRARAMNISEDWVRKGSRGGSLGRIPHDPPHALFSFSFSLPFFLSKPLWSREYKVSENNEMCLNSGRAHSQLYHLRISR